MEESKEAQKRKEEESMEIEEARVSNSQTYHNNFSNSRVNNSQFTFSVHKNGPNNLLRHLQLIYITDPQAEYQNLMLW